MVDAEIGAGKVYKPTPAMSEGEDVLRSSWGMIKGTSLKGLLVPKFGTI